MSTQGGVWGDEKGERGRISYLYLYMSTVCPRMSTVDTLEMGVRIGGNEHVGAIVFADSGFEFVV